MNVIITESPVLTVNVDEIEHVNCNGDTTGSITVTASGGAVPYSYSWSNGDTTASNNHLSSGDYVLTLTDANGCIAVIDTSITEPPAIKIEFINITHVFCYGGNNGSTTLHVTGGTPPYTYTWDPSVSTDTIASGLKVGNYTVMVGDSNNCEESASITISEPDSLIVLISGPATVCERENAVLTATVIGGTSPYSYTWTPGTMNTSAVTVSPEETTTYTVTITDLNGCTTISEEQTLVVNVLPVVLFNADTSTGCSPLCVLFSNNSPNYMDATWDFGGGKTETGAEITRCYPDPGVYTVTLTVTDSNGCSNSRTAPDLIKVYSNPEADFTITPPDVAPVSSEVHFNNQSIGTTNWFWNFGDVLKSTSTLKNPAFIYVNIGTYTVSLTVTNNEGCMDSVSHTITIEPEFSLYIPNSFTPGNDGINDFFAPKGAEFESFEMEIYNRWGERIYYTALPNLSREEGLWNGTVNGKDSAPEGVYVYKIQVKDFKGKTHYFLGNVTLIK